MQARTFAHSHVRTIAGVLCKALACIREGHDWSRIRVMTGPA